MPLVLYTWMATVMRTKDRTENVMIFDRDVHMAAKVAALDDPPQVCSLQLTKQKRSDRARSYHHEVTQRVQAGIDQTRLAQCELWIQFGMPMWVEDEHVGYTRLHVSAAEEPSQHAHAKGADEDVDYPGDDDDEPLLTESDRRFPRKSTQARAFQAREADEDEPRASQAPKPKKPKAQAAALFSEASSGDDDYTDPKATVRIARPRIPKASGPDAQNVLIRCLLFFLVSECSEAVCNCSELRCCMSRIARLRKPNRKMVSFYSI